MISAVPVYGIILFLTGLALRYRVNRRRFNRRNVAGLQTFSSYGQSVAISLFERLVKFIGLVMLLFSLYLMAIEWMNHRFNKKYRQGNQQHKTAQHLS